MFLYQHVAILLVSSYEDTISILLNIQEKDLLLMERMAETTLELLAAAIQGDSDCDVDAIAEGLLAIAKAINPMEYFPMSRKEFDEVAEFVDESLVDKLMQDCFGCTKLLVGLNTRKVAVAIDLIDWEGLGFTRRSDVKMKDVKAAYVEGSTQKWLPKGLGRSFQEAVEQVGALIGMNKIGTQGKVQACINKHFKPAEKEKLIAMRDAILRYYKASKCGAKKQFQF